MFTLVVLLIALALLVFSVVMKNIEISRGRKVFLSRLFAKSDEYIFKLLSIIKTAWSHINFKNAGLIFLKIIASIRKVVTTLKRRFDHKQSHFFVKRDHDLSKNKGAVSFFLKDISEHKKSLRENKEE